jgi:hypothetical protein
LEANATSKEKMVEWESLTLIWTKEYLLVTQVQGKSYKCYNLRLNKVVESINVTIDETGRLESKKEENKSMEQLFEEENEKEEEEEDEDEDEENPNRSRRASSTSISKDT